MCSSPHHDCQDEGNRACFELFFLMFILNHRSSLSQRLPQLYQLHTLFSLINIFGPVTRRSQIHRLYFILKFFKILQYIIKNRFILNSKCQEERKKGAAFLIRQRLFTNLFVMIFLDSVRAFRAVRRRLLTCTMAIAVRDRCLSI